MQMNALFISTNSEGCAQVFKLLFNSSSLFVFETNFDIALPWKVDEFVIMCQVVCRKNAARIGRM